MVIAPPLTLTHAEADDLIAKVHKVLDLTHAHVGEQSADGLSSPSGRYGAASGSRSLGYRSHVDAAPAMSSAGGLRSKSIFAPPRWAASIYVRANPCTNLNAPRNMIMTQCEIARQLSP
jgi:hypothetical protein